MSKLIPEENFKDKLASLKGWQIIDGELAKAFDFPDFISALRFVNAIGRVAEFMDHHPDILLSYGKVEVLTTTHSQKGLTDKDFELARAIDGIRPD
ncbi:MAG: 4a-hydroxytetrahydrobiopterin dehydratase [Candidatus Taylorbacteria bacterium]|nr:4a-hydroxytetrahydrobiopterin dehydratase [Candidatus Taylorbacteria bacterium]